MLRLKQAMDECGIQQKALCDASGFGKSQVSLTLNSGKLPANWEKFRDGAYRLIAEENGLAEWLAANNMYSDQLLETVPDHRMVAISCPTEPAPDLERVLCEIAGRESLKCEGRNNLVLALACATSHLHKTLSDLVGEDAPYLANKEAEVFNILKGVRP